MMPSTLPQPQVHHSSPPGNNYQYTSPAPRPGGETVPSPSNSGAANPASVTAAFNSLTLSGGASRPQASSGNNASQGSQRSQPTAPHYISSDGVMTQLTNIQEGQIVNVFNPNNQVRTLFQTGPQDKITDPTLLQNSKGKGAYRMLMNTGSQGDTEQLFYTFEVRTSPRRFFTVGKVFMVLWAEPAGEQKTLVTGGISTSKTSGITQGKHGEMVFSKVRRFVVIREALNYCSALPITTYGSQGVGKSHVTKSEHAIIYTGRNPPNPMSSEEPVRGEQGMRPDPIRVDPDDKEDKLDPRSRIDFGKVHTIQHNIKVKSYGKVNEKSMQALQKQFNLCWYATSVPMVSPSSPPAPMPSSSRGQGDTRAPAAVRRPSVSDGNRSSALRGSNSGGSQTGQLALPRSQPTAPGAEDSRRRLGERETIARLQEQRRQEYWDAVDQLVERNRCTREEAMEAINARLAQRRAAAIRKKNTDDEDDDDDD